MNTNYLYSVILELLAANDATLPVAMGHQAHGLFLDLIHQINPPLATRLHDEANYRPFTVSALRGTKEHGKSMFLKAGQPYTLRLTLLDGGQLWQGLSHYFLTTHKVIVHLGHAEFLLQRIRSTPSTEAVDWAGYTDWQTLASTKPRRFITLHFASPTAFSLGDRRFALFPEPLLVWDSLLRTWNSYAPTILHIEKSSIRDFVAQQVMVSDYTLHTTTLYFPKYTQKGFQGTCTYFIKTESGYAAQLTALADFARFAGIGYKTTMGMGQAYIEDAQ